MKVVTYKKYRGLSLGGTVPMDLPTTNNHLDHASWLTAQVESGGKFGCCINYDGTGMTAGIHQAIAVYPKELANEDNNPANDQGPLWKLLWQIYSKGGTEKCSFWDLLFEVDYELDPTGHVVDHNGNLIPGLLLRKELCGSEEGVMPTSGPEYQRAGEWMSAFHTLFTHPETFEVQLAFGKKHFLSLVRSKLNFSKKHSNRNLEELVYRMTPSVEEATVEMLGEATDLAMSVFLSHSVNAPGMAKKVICKVVDSLLPDTKDRTTFAKKLLSTLGNTKYGRWDDDIVGGRYQRTRSYAMRLWPRYLFEGPGAIMPKDLVG